MSYFKVNMYVYIWLPIICMKQNRQVHLLID